MGFRPQSWLGWIATFIVAVFLFAHPAAAQAPANGDNPAPSFTTDQLRSEIERLQSVSEEDEDPADGLTSEQREQIISSLNSAIDRIEAAARQGQVAAQFQADVQTGEDTLEALRSEVETLQEEIRNRPPLDGDATLVGEAAMFATEQSLLAKESELRALQAQLEAYRTQSTEIGSRLIAAPRELNTARTQLGEVSSSLSALGTGDLDPVGEARRKALQAREYALRRQISALEAEISSLPIRQEIITSRRNLAELRANALTEEIFALQDLTGQRKVVEAAQQAQQARDFVDSLTDLHPLVAEMAAENLRLADTLTQMALDESVTSRKLASVRGMTANVQNDLTAATELVSLGQLDREAGATLRRLGDQLPPAIELRGELRETQRDLARLTRQRVVAQEQLRDLPIGIIDPRAMLERARVDNPALPDLGAEAAEAIAQLAEQRRAFLRQISANATGRINAVAELQTAQNDLSGQTEELRTVLDENLLWVPSVPAVDLTWPEKVVRGAVELFSPDHVSTTLTVLIEQTRRFWPVVLLFGLAMLSAYRLRPALRQDMEARAKSVGRVKQDSLWHTPAVIGAGIIMALPWPLFFALLAFLFEMSDNPDLLVRGLANGFAYLSAFALIIVTWKYWDEDDSLFGTHFKLPKRFRNIVEKNLFWFLPVVGTSSFMLAVTSNMRGSNIYEGLSLAVFILTALSLAVFSFLVLRRRKDNPSSLIAGSELFSRYRLPLLFIGVVLPVFAAFMAGAGWYDSADDILVRLFMTMWVLLLSYVIYGVVRRAITVSQRQIKYRQALERREAAIKARQEKQEAEARGEEMPPPPPIDTDAIDVTAMSRQSEQLLKTIIAVGLVAGLWFIWSGLLPALTIFDGLELGAIGTGDIDPDTGEEITRSITVWTILQGLVIATITIIAARNLPGFLEIFVLNRLGVDAGARYAVVTILGYIIVATGFIIVFQRIGLEWDQLRWIVTGLSVGIGFGLQKIIANFVSGLILLFERPIRIGDFVTIGDKSGTVTRIKIRATTLGDLDNREILIPNENLISQEVTNWTLSNSVTRVIVRVGIAYGSDTDRARDVMLETLKNTGKILDTPPPQVFFLGFGDSSLDFELRFFLRKFEDRFPVSHQVHTDVNKALAEHGFEIPFPQRDLNWRGQTAPFEMATRGRGSAPKKTAKEAKGEVKKAPPPHADWDSGTGLEDVEGDGDGGSDGGGD